jgi:hypothetical protein
MQDIDNAKNFWDAYYLIQVAALQCQSALALNLLENATEHMAESFNKLKERS